MKSFFATAVFAVVLAGSAWAAGISTSRSNIPRSHKSAVAQDSSASGQDDSTASGMRRDVDPKGRPSSGIASSKAAGDTLRDPDSDDDGASTSRVMPTVNKKTTAVSSGGPSGNPPGMSIDEAGTTKVKKPSTKVEQSGGTMTGDAADGKRTADSLATP